MPLLNDGVICVGHSLGGITLAKYFSEAPCAIKIKAVFLVAAPFNTATQHPLVDFNILNNLALLAEQIPRIFLYHSQDDQVVPFYNMLGYQVLLPHAAPRVFTDRQHFTGSELPEIVADIQALI
jgi:predicted alpha/beta hydrolase family esterase